METNLKELIEHSHDPKENQRNVDDIINMVTAENLCSCRDPINMAFQVHSQKMCSVTPFIVFGGPRAFHDGYIIRISKRYGQHWI